MTRRTAIIAGTAAASIAAGQNSGNAKPQIPSDLIAAHDKGVDSLVERQVLDPKSKYRGSMPDATGLYYPGTASGIIESLTSALVCPGSKHHQSSAILERLGFAVDYAIRSLSPDGNIHLPITNFNSPPDTAFFTLNTASAAHHARQFGAREISRLLEPLLRPTTEALIKGGIHTPNHRWVVCAALSQLNDLKPDSRITRRIDQWLAEGIDINADGQFSELSVGVYSNICDRAFVVMADKLKRPELLDPARRNLDSLLNLLHPNGDVVTEGSVRQDRNMRVPAGIYWFPLKYLAVTDRNGKYESVIRECGGQPWLGALLEYPQLLTPVTPSPLPVDFEKQLPSMNLTRIRRGATSVTLHHRHNDRFLSLRRGSAIVQAVRFASAFFGKAQFVPERMEQREGGYYLEQTLEGPYYQPLEKPQGNIVDHDQWSASRKARKQTEVCKLKQSAFWKEEANGFSLRIQASGTDEVPLAVEISLAPGGLLEGCDKLRDNVYLLSKGSASYKSATDGFRFGPGLKSHTYVDVRGALPRVEGTSVYLTGMTPFDHTIRFEWL